MDKVACKSRNPFWRAGCTGALLLGLSGFGLPASASQDLRIDGEVLPAKSIQLLEQALSRVKPDSDAHTLRLGLVENHVLARAVEAELELATRQDLEALVEVEAANLIEQVYGQQLQHDLAPFLIQPKALSSQRLRETLAPKSQGVVLNSLLLSEAQQAEAMRVELISWQFPDQPTQRLNLLELYRGVSVQGQVELQQGNLRLMAQLVHDYAMRDYLWYQLARQGYSQAQLQGVRRLVRDKLVRHKYLQQIGLLSDFHHETAGLKQLARSVSDADAEAYYRRNLAQYRNVAQVQAAHIRLPDQASADRVYAELQQGLDFEQAVRRYSIAEDKQRARPGDLGLIRYDDPHLDFLRKTALIQKADTFSQPMLIEGGFEIVQVRTREDRQLPLSDPSVRYEVNQAVAKEQLAAQFQARLQALTAAARVEGL
ncbi:peptidylprolyl isomerase [Pseudomonas taeanensis MS-3]|uniref:peptidylprolyl isomerase n=1 Tax=Pseudomonas taeanensis MS-3 TaxID=1395571 RepID=A0A0A1YP68_9PSED|nr:peptidylprolyl isomerase [Pseudomonas taeanensis]KFX70871.1 peptidylprolyl isomerase [Pseudomonas taeanensis MS-3]